MASWETVASGYLRAMRLETIRSKLFAFALLATLIPSLSTAWVSYWQNKRSLQDKITGELRSVSLETARETDLWLKERLYDLRVFASSYEVSENLERSARAEGAALRRLNDYLKSVRDRFTDYEELLVLDKQGRVVASSAPRPNAVPLPAAWLRDVRGGNATLGDAYWDASIHKVLVVAAVPIRHASGRFLGALAAKINLTGVDAILQRGVRTPSSELYLVEDDGRVISSARFGSATPVRAALAPTTAQDLLNHEATTVEYAGLDGARVVGTLRRVPRLGWSVVAEVPSLEAFRQVHRLRNETALIVFALLGGIGLLAYLLGLVIVRPLNRLTTGAALVARGNLDVDLPVTGGGEVGYLTEVFNNMVTRLRKGRDDLERLSVTDPLTKLYNRRQLMVTLANELQRCRRYSRSLTLLMADVDHFKKFNDSHGHQAGDQALAQVAAALQASTRELDCVARYGGEEFVVVLPETPIDVSREVTDRIRARLAAEPFPGDKITVSIGVAEFPTHGDTAEAIIGSADAALYQAKRKGRNRVEHAARERPKSPA